MLKPLWSSLSKSVSAIGGQPPDAELRTQKTVLVVLSLAAIPMGLIWTPIELSMGDTASGVATAVIGALILINFTYYAFSKNYTWFRFSQLSIFLSFPFVLHLTVGGSRGQRIWSGDSGHRSSRS